MSGPIYKRGKCELCGKGREHDNHSMTDSRPLWRRLLWPAHLHGPIAYHDFVDRDRRVDAADGMARLKRRLADRREA